MNKTRDGAYLGEESIYLLLLKFSVPTALTLLVNYIYNIADQIFIGQGTGLEGVAATNAAFPITIIGAAAALLIGDGCAANISLSLGEDEGDSAEKFLGAAFFMLIFVSVMLVAFGEMFLTPIVKLMGAAPSVLGLSVDYAGIIILGLPFSIINISFTAIIRADGSPRYTMLAMLTGAVINVVLDYIFIFKFNWGVRGAAAATITGQCISAILCLRYIPRFKSFAFKRENMRPRAFAVKKIIMLGLPSFITQTSVAATQIAMNNLMKGCGAASIYGSEIALSCYGIMMKINQLAHAMFVGLSSGAQPINGYNYGAKNYHRVRETYMKASGIAMLISVLWYIVFRFFSVPITSVFVDGGPLYREFAEKCFSLYMAAFFVFGLPRTTAAFFQSTGKTGRAMLLTLCSQALFKIPLAIILSKACGINGALFSAAISDVMSFALALGLALHEFYMWRKLGRL